jgi:hypothetical protein
MSISTLTGRTWRAVAWRCARVLPLLLLLPLTAAENGAPGGTLPGWGEPVSFCRKPEGNLTLTFRWLPEDGFRLAVISRKGGAVALELNAERLLATDLAPDGTLAGEPRATLFHPAEVLRSPHNRAELTLKFRDTDWMLYLDGELVASLAAPFEPPADVCLPATGSPELQDKPLFRPVPKEEFMTDFMIEEGAPNELYPWKIECGKWHIHTAMQDALVRPESNLERMKTVPLTADKSPNFYSLKGGGLDAEKRPVESVLTTGYDFFDQYEYAAAMQVNQGEAGLVFYHRGEGASDFYAFTIDLASGNESAGSLRLWRAHRGERRVLARVGVPLFRDQWHRPMVRIDKDEIVCYLDAIEVIRIRERLPVGGKIGLYSLSPEELRFDDVKLTALSQVPLRTVGEIAYQALYQDGTFLRPPGLLTSGTPEDRQELAPGRRSHEQILALGRPHHQQTVFSATYAPEGNTWAVGLLCGFRSPDKPYYRFLVERTKDRETFRLERVRRGGIQTLDSWEQPLSPGGAPAKLLLMADATDPTRLNLLRDNVLVLMLPLDQPLQGASGLLLGARTGAVVSDLAYAFHRELYYEQEQKNQVFQQDSFMRHWASPEGQWIAGPDSTLWHKGDFFSDYRLRLPCVADSEFHAGATDDATEGPMVVAVGKDSITLKVTEPGASAPAVYAQPVTPPAGTTLDAMNYEFHHEGYWCWVSLDGATVARHRLSSRPAGTRCFVKGMGLAHMTRSRATRANVIDDFFNESPHAWTVNGGNWQIINRFQCTPSWSHMAGESADGLAALWHKTLFTGDLTLEFYAGTRMGWYDRLGDLNCTIMADTASPSRGYTLTCCEFDYNLSQNWSTLYRNGQVVARSDKYTVPRRRAGSVRKYMDPLISEGRPVHGAWYYIKLRKIGKRIEYYFDNQPIFATEDPEVLNQGLVGIWTFIHSMTLAQVKITFQQAQPRAFPVTRLPLNQPPSPTPSAPPAAAAGTAPEAAPASAQTAPAPAWPVSANGFPLDSLDASFWSVHDTVGHAVLEPFQMNAAALRLTNRLGSGNMLLKPVLPPLPLSSLAGWRFQLRRTPTACLNLYYSIGTAAADGTFTPLQACFHQISGCAFTDGAYRRTGQTEVPGSERVDRPGGDWYTVTAWIPTSVRTPQDEASKLMVRLDGLGNLQPGPVLCGIQGNAPGDGFAVRDLTPVVYGVPEVAVGTTPEPLRFALLDRPGGRRLGEATGDDPPAQLAALLKEHSRDGLNSLWLRVFDRKGNAMHHTLAWVQLPAAPSASLAWDPDCLDTLRLDLRCGYPDPRLAAATVTLGSTTLPLEPVGWEEARRVRLPRAPARPEGTDVTLALALAGTTSPHRFTLARQPRNPGPVLLAVEGLKSFCSTFEGADVAPLSLSSDGRMAILGDDPVQGRYLEVRNRELEQRLSTSYTLGFSIAEFPLMQMRYRAFDMTHASITFANYHYVRLNDDYASAAPVRLAHDLKLDEAWHTWTGFVGDGFVQQPFATTRFTPASLTLGSAGSPDQTGRYSRWHLDDVTFGPAVAKPEQLAFVPRYDDSDGVQTVLAAISAGETAYADLSADQQQALAWKPFAPGTPLALAFDGLSDGVQHLLLRAVDTRGAESPVTDIPFLLDTQPLQPSTAFGPLADPASNGVVLGISFANQGGAPWVIEKAVFSVAGTALQLPAWTSLFVHAPQSDSLALNYPLVCRANLDAAANGDTIEFAVDNIVDGAGNATPKVTVPIKVDYASDKTGPAWYYLQFATGVHWWWNWDGYRNTSPAFSPGQYNQATVVHTVGDTPYLQHLTYYTTGDLSHAVTWNPTTHPWLSFRMRQPSYAASRPIQLHIILTTTDSRAYSISLNQPATAATELNRTQTIAWDAAKWNRLSFNVRDLLKAAGVTDDVLAKTVISAVGVQRRGTQHQEALFLDDFFIHGPAADPSKLDPLQWYAYDASGVGSLQVECVADDDQVQWTDSLPLAGADLNTLRAKLPAAHAWLRCSAKDKAGNLSVPFWLPLAK